MLSEKFLNEEQKLLDRLDQALASLKSAGADAAHAAISESISFSLQCRHQKIINTDHAESRELGLQVFIGQRHAGVSVSLDRLKDMKELAARVVAMAKAAPEDPYCGLAENPVKITCAKKLDLCDPKTPNPDDLKADILEAEETALAQKNIANSEGAQAGWSLAQIAHMTSGGFHGVERFTRHDRSCIALAEKNGVMERDYEFCSARHAQDMMPPAQIGLKAAEQAAARLGSRKPKSCTAPVIYHPRVARSLLSHFAAAISGAAIARGSSFLKDDMNKQIFPQSINIIDDPYIHRGLRSQLFDSEGVGGQKRSFIQNGRLTGWMMDWPSARQLGLESTGHASSALGGTPTPSPTNFWMEAGSASPDDLIAGIENGLYVVELIGSGASIVTGDYSRGAAGFWIEHGKITHPVNEITIAGHLRDIFANLVIGNDLLLRYGVDAPTVRVAQMAIAGA